MEKNAVRPQGDTWEQVKRVIRTINKYIDLVGSILYHLRKPVLTVPVVYYALKLASYNQKHLPPQVGINLQPSGEFAFTIARQMAVLAPLGLTAGCLAMMFLSKKATYPWIISVFTLTLPILLLVSNIYPG